MFDINLYTRLIIVANQYKDLNFITKDDLYDFIELDNDFETGIVDHDLDIESLDPDEYVDTYAGWAAEAAMRYENMRSEYLMQSQKYYDKQMDILKEEIHEKIGPLSWVDLTVRCNGDGSIGFVDDGETEEEFFGKMTMIKEYIAAKGYNPELIKFDKDKDHNYYEAIINFNFEGGEQ